nr:NUDIX domain-containing protein [Butyricicoccus sp. OF10-2]
MCGIWLQQRQFDRPLFPGGFDLTSTGHIDPGETPQTAVLREAREESGLQLTAADLIDGGSYRQRYSRGEGGFDDELAYTFLARIDGIPPFRPGPEVAEMLFVPLADFAAAQEQGASLTGLTPDGRTMEMPNESLAVCTLRSGRARNRVSKHFLTKKNSRLPLDKGRRLPYNIDIHQYGTRNPL